MELHPLLSKLDKSISQRNQILHFFINNLIALGADKMKLHKETHIQIVFDCLLTNNGLVEIDQATQKILTSLLSGYRIRQDYWIPILLAWYNRYPYVSLKDIDSTELMEFTSHFKFFMLCQLQKFLEARVQSLREVFRNNNVCFILKLYFVFYQRQNTNFFILFVYTFHGE